MPTRIELASNKLIYSLKHDNRKDTFNFLSRELATAISFSLEIRGREDLYILTNVPRRSAALRRDGYDHAAELAKRIGKMLGIRYISLLKSNAKKAQREMRGDERRKNARFAYKRKAKAINLKGITVILVDDVVTTGSSLAAASDLLRGLGTRNVIGAAISIAYKDSYVKPEIKY